MGSGKEPQETVGRTRVHIGLRIVCSLTKESRNTSKYLGHWVEVLEVYCFQDGIKIDIDKDFPILVLNDILLR